METDKNTLIQGLIKQVEEALHRKPTTPKDFELASDTISRQTNVRLSKTTLMRMWGYVKEDVEPREFTLTTLARFCGYASWQNFTEQYSIHGDQQSNPIMQNKIDVLDDLMPGDQVRFTWQTCRVMMALYHGAGNFEVTYSERTRLRKGTTFSCFLTITQEPLFLSKVNIDGSEVGAYVCGKVNGVQFEIFKKNQ